MDQTGAREYQVVGSVEVIDPRILNPYDDRTMIESVAKTGRVIIIDEGYRSYSVTGEIASRIYEQAFDCLDGPIKRIAALGVPIPFSPPLESATIPDQEQTVAAAYELLGI